LERLPQMDKEIRQLRKEMTGEETSDSEPEPAKDESVTQ